MKNLQKIFNLLKVFVGVSIFVHFLPVKTRNLLKVCNFMKRTKPSEECLPSEGFSKSFFCLLKVFLSKNRENSSEGEKKPSEGWTF